jgi:hypothetical protein
LQRPAVLLWRLIDDVLLAGAQLGLDSMTAPDETLDRLIYNGQVMSGIQHIRKTLGISLGDAILYFYKRVHQLSKSNPEKFTVSIKDYFKDTYS